MSRESDFYGVASEDDTLVAILTGGIYTVESLGLEGISRAGTPDAFNENGFLLPTALIRQRERVTDDIVNDIDENVVSVTQAVEIYIYDDTGYTNIDAALARLYTLFQGYVFSDSFPVEWLGTLDRQRDFAALGGACLARQDWIVYSIQQGG